MPRADYTVIAFTHELPVTKTYTKPGQRSYFLRAPGVKVWSADDRPLELCMCQVVITQIKGSKLDQEGYYVSDITNDAKYHVPPGCPAYLFECYTAEPTPERPGIYIVVCGRNNLPEHCGCLGSRGHQQQSDCKHKSVVYDLAMNPI